MFRRASAQACISPGFADAELAQIRIGRRFSEDDVIGFVRFLEANCGVIVERRDANETVVRRRK